MAGEHEIDLEQITPKWLTEKLRLAKVIRDSSVKSISAEQMAQGKAWLSSIIKLNVEYDYKEASAPNSLILKLLSESRENRNFDYERGAYQREINFYNVIAKGLPIRLPELFYSESRDDSNLMLMEDLSYLSPGDQIVGMTYEQVLGTLKVLAKVHASYWNNPVLDSYGWLPPTNNIEHDYSEKWDSFAELCGGFIDPDALKVGERLARNISWLFDEISKRPMTLVHDDMKTDNLLFGETGTNMEVVILDWQFVIKSIGAIDAARLIGGSWFSGDRRGHEFDALQYWYNELLDCGVQNYSIEDAKRDIKLGALYNLCFPVHFHKGITRAHGRALEYIKILYSGLFDFAFEIDTLSILD